MTAADLYAAARAAAGRAHAPYSGLRVGAVIETPDGARHPGANVEFASYGLALCAERAALVRAVFEGGREFARIAVARADGEPIAPCGACRQALADFGLDLAVIYWSPEGLVEQRLGDLLPAAFELEPGAGR